MPLKRILSETLQGREDAENGERAKASAVYMEGSRDVGETEDVSDNPAVVPQQGNEIRVRDGQQLFFYLVEFFRRTGG